MMRRAAAMLVLACSLAGCGGAGEGRPLAGFAAPPPPGAVLTAETLAAPPSPPLDPAGAGGASGAGRGAIFQASQGYAALVTGTRARALGDMVMIVLTENTNTTKSATGQTSREGELGITPPARGPLDFLDPEALKAAAQASFTGQGNAAQQSRLSGAVAVTITAIYPNGTAEVVGEKQMILSQGEEWVQFAGRIRLVDIDADNRLPSSQVANARMVYSGRGAVQQASRPGWLSRFFNVISPF